MIGAIIGDIAGSVYEFDNIKTKDFVMFGNYKGQACTFTDDTVMTAAVALALISVKEEGGDLARKTDIFMHSLGKLYPNAGYGERFGMWVFFDEHEPYHSYGNGAAMRVSPVAYAASSMEEVKSLSKTVTEITHNHPEGLKGAEATAVCTWMALQGATKQEIRKYVCAHYYSLALSLDEIRPGYSFNETCQDTVPQAITAFLESTDFEDAIRNAISLGGDSDTLACITGAIAGAHYGVPDDIRRSAITFLDNRIGGILGRFELTFGTGDN